MEEREFFREDEIREHEDLQRREYEEIRALEIWERRRYEPNEGFGPIYRANEGDD